MKTKRSIIGLLFIILILSGCDVAKSTPYAFDYQVLNAKVVGVEIQYKDPQTLQDEQLYIFQENEIPSFLEEFCGFSFHEVGPAGPSVKYYLIKLLYNDGSFDLIGAYGGQNVIQTANLLNRCRFVHHLAARRIIICFQNTLRSIKNINVGDYIIRTITTRKKDLGNQVLFDICKKFTVCSVFPPPFSGRVPDGRWSCLRGRYRPLLRAPSW